MATIIMTIVAIIIDILGIKVFLATKQHTSLHVIIKSGQPSNLVMLLPPLYKTMSTVTD